MRTNIKGITSKYKGKHCNTISCRRYERFESLYKLDLLVILIYVIQCMIILYLTIKKKKKEEENSKYSFMT